MKQVWLRVMPRWWWFGLSGLLAFTLFMMVVSMMLAVQGGSWLTPVTFVAEALWIGWMLWDSYKRVKALGRSEHSISVTGW